MKILDLYHRNPLRSNMEIIFYTSLNHCLKLHCSDLLPSVLRSFCLTKYRKFTLPNGMPVVQVRKKDWRDKGAQRKTNQRLNSL